MSNLSKIDRRIFLAGNISMLVLCSASSLANATETSWENADFFTYKPLIGDMFQAWTDTGERYSLKLHSVRRVALGSARPRDLKRRYGMTLIFTSHGAGDVVSKGGHAVMHVHHPQLGTHQLYFDTEKTRTGRYRFELNFN